MNVKALLKKWYIILLCALLCAGGLYIEKSQVTNVIPQSGDMTYIRVVKFDSVPLFTANQTSTEVNLTNLMRAWSNLTDLETQLVNRFDITKLNADWKKNSDSQKMKWLGGHFRVQNMGPGLYELIIQFDKKDGKDSQYIKDNHEALMDLYQSYFTESAQMVTTNTRVTPIKEIEKIDEEKVMTRADVAKKYAIIGFILGSLLGVVIVMVWDAQKKRKQ